MTTIDHEPLESRIFLSSSVPAMLAEAPTVGGLSAVLMPATRGRIPSVLGTYRGRTSVTKTNGQTLPAPLVIPVTLRILAQSGARISGQVIRMAGIYSGTGTIKADGTFTFKVSPAVFPEGITLTGKVSRRQISGKFADRYAGNVMSGTFSVKK